jgi:protein HOOK3
LKKIAQQAQNLKDEVDILKHTSDKVEKLESSIQTYRIKVNINDKL